MKMYNTTQHIHTCTHAYPTIHTNGRRPSTWGGRPRSSTPDSNAPQIALKMPVISTNVGPLFIVAEIEK